MKTWFNDIKESLSNAVKFTMLTVFMIIGLWFSYYVIWSLLGLPQTDWALWVLFAVALVSGISVTTKATPRSPSYIDSCRAHSAS